MKLKSIAHSTKVLAEEATADKPDPAPYQLVLNQLAISPKEEIAFEDSGSGIQAAVGAGIYTIGVASTHEPDDLLKAGAAMVIPDFQEHQLWLLLESLQEMNSSSEAPPT